jgi:hypothetical protein
VTYEKPRDFLCCYHIYRQIPCFPVNLPLSEALALFLPDCVSRHVATWITNFPHG